jgi:DNA-binding transcriptional LysR family regulator
MDLRQLRYFVAIAEELNFSRAALRLNMSQPPLSHQIKLLENELGVVLLDRNKREVKLTTAGRTLLKDSKALLDQAQVTLQRARLSGQRKAGTLRVGMTTSAIDVVMPRFLECLRERGAHPEVVLTDMLSKDQVQALAQDRIDLGFIHSRSAAKNLARIPAHFEALAVVVPKRHALATKDDLSLPDLADEPLISFSREHRSALYDSLVASCMNAGFSPRLVHVARHPTSMVQMVRHGLGICVIPESYADAADPDLRVFVLPPEAGVIQIDAVWRPDSSLPVLQEVVDFVLPGMMPNA